MWSDKVSAEAVQLAHQRGLKVWVYTINDPDLANKLLDMGVDGIITNNTSLIWQHHRPANAHIEDIRNPRITDLQPISTGSSPAGRKAANESVQ